VGFFVAICITDKEFLQNFYNYSKILSYYFNSKNNLGFILQFIDFDKF